MGRCDRNTAAGRRATTAGRRAAGQGPPTAPRAAPAVSSDDYARAVIAEGQRHGITERGIVMALSTTLVESDLVMYANYADPESLDYPHDAIGSNENSVGLFQQRAPWWGTCADRMDAARSAGMFYDDLARLDYNNPAQTAGWYCYQVQQCAAEYAYRYDERMPEAQQLYDRLAGQPAGEVVLPYDHSVTPQETGYWCGPAATQVVLNGQGVIVSEQQLANQMGTDTDGTDDIGLIQAVLAGYLPAADYRAAYMPNDPPSAAERDALWSALCNSIRAGCGVVMNWVAPPSNYPVGIKGSQSPKYAGGTVYHYVSCMGIDDNPTQRACWIADSGFAPYGYWCAFDQVATLIPPKGYTYSAQPTAGLPPITRPPAAQLPAELTDREIAEQIWTQLLGPGGNGWPQLGQNAAGQYLTLVDAVARLVNPRHRK